MAYRWRRWLPDALVPLVWDVELCQLGGADHVDPKLLMQVVALAENCLVAGDEARSAVMDGCGKVADAGALPRPELREVRAAGEDQVCECCGAGFIGEFWYDWELREGGREAQNGVGVWLLCGAADFVDEFGGYEEAEDAAECRSKQAPCRIRTFAVFHNVEEDVHVEDVDRVLKCWEEVAPKRSSALLKSVGVRSSRWRMLMRRPVVIPPSSVRTVRNPARSQN